MRFLSQVFSPGDDGRMHFQRVIGGQGYAPGRFDLPTGVAVGRGLLIVSEGVDVGRLQVLTLAGVPLQVLTPPDPLDALCADEERVWVCSTEDAVDSRITMLTYANA